MAKLTSRSALTTPANGDLVHVVDISDTTSDPAGTSKKLTVKDLGVVLNATDSVLVNDVSDLPAAVSGVITLAANTQYVIGSSINVGTDRFVLSDNTAVAGLDSVISTITYTGTGDLFTMSDVTASVENLTLTATSGRLFNYTDTGSRIFRAKELIVNCDKWGIFTSTSDTIVRFNNVAGTVATDGLEFSGDFRNLFWDTSRITMTAGALFNLGTATFDSVTIDLILLTLNGSSNLISGQTGSANINAGGIGLVERTIIDGPGTPLVNITVGDALWQFFGNDDIADTRPDALSSIQSNSTETVINTQSVFELVAGTWVEESANQFTTTDAGRFTYTGGKDFRSPITFQCTVEPASGTNKIVGLKVAKNGTLIDNSMVNLEVDAGAPLNMSVVWQETFSTGDYVELFVANGSGTQNILVSGAVARLN